MNSGIGESDFEILIAVFAGAMMDRTVGIVGSRDEPTVRNKPLIRIEAFDAVDF